MIIVLEKLENKLKELKKVAIAYSGRIDSSFLLLPLSIIEHTK